MKKIYGILLIGLLIFGCKEKTKDQNLVLEKIQFNQKLVEELEKMAEIDQVAASNAFPPKNYSYLSQPKWEAFKDSVFRKNQKRTEEIFDKYGFVGYDLAGPQGSADFWLVIQHSDHNPQFQSEILKKMKIEVDKENADSRNYGLLVDRVKLNTGEAQIYGTQVDYNMEICQAYPRKLADSINVNIKKERNWS